MRELLRLTSVTRAVTNRDGPVTPSPAGASSVDIGLISEREARNTERSLSRYAQLDLSCFLFSLPATTRLSVPRLTREVGASACFSENHLQGDIFPAGRWDWTVQGRMVILRLGKERRHFHGSEFFFFSAKEFKDAQVPLNG